MYRYSHFPGPGLSSTSPPKISSNACTRYSITSKDCKGKQNVGMAMVKKDRNTEDNFS